MSRSIECDIYKVVSFVTVGVWLPPYIKTNVKAIYVFMKKSFEKKNAYSKFKLLSKSSFISGLPVISSGLVGGR
jgi:hypothetical protein